MEHLRGQVPKNDARKRLFVRFLHGTQDISYTVVPQFVRDSRIQLTVGFFVLSVGTIVAHQTPAEHYEPSIFTSTPNIFWAVIVGSLVIATLVTFASDSVRFQRLGMALAGLSMTTVVLVPLIRGYYFLGEGDSLSHLGVAYEINKGVLLPTDNRYPIIHTLTSMTSDLTGLNLRFTLLLYIPVFTISFFIFVPLCVRILSTHERVVRIGVFSALLLLPINNLASHLLVHPTSQAVLFTPVVMYAFFRHYIYSSWRSAPLLVVLSVTLVLLHPQQAANFLLFVAGIILTQLGHRYFKSSSRLQGTRRTILSFLIMSALFWLWVKNLDRFESAFSYVVVSMFTISDIAPSTTSRSSSLAHIGGSIEIVFLKLFFVSLLFCVLAGIFMLYTFLDELDPRRWAVLERFFPFESGNYHVLMVYIMFGFSGVTGIFMMYLAIGISGQYFRHLAFMMVLVTIVGAVALAKTISAVQTAIPRPQGAGVTILIVFVLLLASIPIVYSSPYMYQDSNHITEAQMEGFDTTFRYQDKSNDWLYIRSEPDRYLDGLRGKSHNEPLSGVVVQRAPNHFGENRLPAQRNKPFYLSVTGKDKSTQAELYQGINFNSNDFRYLQRDKHIHSIHSTGEYKLYIVDEGDS